MNIKRAEYAFQNDSILFPFPGASQEMCRIPIVILLSLQPYNWWTSSQGTSSLLHTQLILILIWRPAIVGTLIFSITGVFKIHQLIIRRDVCPFMVDVRNAGYSQFKPRMKWKNEDKVAWGFGKDM